MINSAVEVSGIEKTTKQDWPTEDVESVLLDDSDWEILDETNSHEVVKRHWFKQNYISKRTRYDLDVTFH